MQLTTPVALESLPFTIPLGTHVFALGSCFAARVGERLAHHLFPTITNPYGTLYNPVSLARALRKAPSPSQVFLHQGAWRSFTHHSSLAAGSLSETEALLGEAEKRKAKAWSDSELLLLTLGTSQVFELRNGGQTVANCHRLPHQLFRRRRLSLTECLDALRPSLEEWLTENHQRRVVITVSPVRYTRDGLVENSRGKALLLLACEELERALPRVHYFPAYEILLDELRDYRYYQEDMVHPTGLALKIVWRRFCKLVLDNDSQQALGELERLYKARQHKFSPGSDRRPLANRSLQRLTTLAKNYNRLNLEEHECYFRSLLEASCDS